MKRTFHLWYYKIHGLPIYLFLVVKSKGSNSLREKCPDTEIFLACILLYSDKIQENTDQKKIRYMDTFHEMILGKISDAKLF